MGSNPATFFDKQYQKFSKGSLPAIFKIAKRNFFNYPVIEKISEDMFLRKRNWLVSNAIINTK